VPSAPPQPSAQPVFSFHLDHYDGPLDLLFDLIRKQQIDIADIPIARITGQYLSYMEQAAEMNIELSAEFVYMAATLIHIKSKMLLPRDPELDKIAPEEDPRRELVDRLLEHERFKAAAEMLQQKRMIEEAVWSNPQMSRFLDESEEPGLDVTLFELVSTFQAVMERLKNRPVFSVDRDDVTVAQMIAHLSRVFGRISAKERVSATELFESQRSRRAVICLFLAILELVKRQAVSLSQSESFGDIDLRRAPGFEGAFEEDSGLASAAEEEYR
jgi:segregation and condensation protein A